MPGGFLDKFFGRSSTPSPEVADALAELGKVVQARPTLAAPVGMLQEILPRLFGDPGDDHVPGLTPEAGEAKLANGIPLLRGENLVIDVPAFRRRWQAVCTAVQRHQNSDGGRALMDALERGDLEPASLIDSVLAGTPEDIHGRADALGLDAGLTTAVLGLVLYPVLARINSVRVSRGPSAGWQHGYCRTCGSWPLLGEFRGLEQTRFLRCGLCAAEWEFPRLLCVFCGERDHRQLGYFSVEGEETRHRALTCETCRGYVKMATSLTPLSAPALLVANVATLHLDLAAADRGYLSPPLTGPV